MLLQPAKISAVVGAALLGAAALLPAQAQEEKAVSVLAIVEHPALDSVRDGVKDELADAGYVEGKNLKWEYQSAQGNVGTAAQIARQYVGARPDVIVGIATPTSQAVVAATKDLPVVYTAVTDPVVAQLVPSFEPSGTNVTGVSDELALEEQINLIKRILPDAKRVGMVYNPGEANSAVVVERMKELLPKHGMELVEAAAPRTVDVSSAAGRLAGNVDVIYTSTDNNVVSAYESLVKMGNDTNTPLIAADTDSVKRGAIAALGLNYYDIGRQTGKIVLRIFEGEAPGDIASQRSDNLDLFVNLKAAEAQGVEVPQAVIDDAAEVIQ